MQAYRIVPVIRLLTGKFEVLIGEWPDMLTALFGYDVKYKGTFSLQ